MASRLGIRHRVAWLAEPWRSASVYVPMVLAFALPGFFLATANRFERAAADAVTSDIVDDVAEFGAGVSVEASGALDPSSIATLDEVVVDRLSEIAALAAPVRTIFTPTGSSAVLRDGDRSAIQAAARLLARPGAIESLDLIASVEGGRGVFVSEDFAARGDLTVGAQIEVVVDGVSAVLPVDGVYRNLWPDPPDAWRALPPLLVPSDDPSTGRPTFEALIIEESVLIELGLPGTVEWSAPAEPAPATLEALESIVDDLTTLESELVRDEGLAAAGQTFSGLSGAALTADSGFPDALNDSRTALRSIESPVAAAQAAGVALGLGAVAANAAFLAVRRQRIWRVLVAGGDGPLRIAGLALGEATVPALVGGVLGILASATATAELVPGSSLGLAAIRFGPVIVATVVAMLLAAMTTALIAIGLGDRRRISALRPAPVVIPLVALAIAGWVQVGSESFQRSVSPVVVFTPIVVLAAAAAVATVGLRAVLERSRARALTTRLPWLLGLRRSAESSFAGLALAAALAVSVGLCVFAVTIAQTRETSVEAKSVTLTGSESQASLVDPIPPGATPPGASGIGRAVLFTTPGNETVEVIAIDGDTYADAVIWPAEFGALQPDEIVDRLARPAGADLPAIVLAGRPVPAEGAFGVGGQFSYDVVGTVDAAPLAPGGRPMLLVRADALEAMGRELFVEDFRAEFGRPPTDADIAELAESPLDQFRFTVVSTTSARELERQAIANGLTAWQFLDRADIAEAPEEQVVRWSFRYLQLVGLVSLAVSLSSVVLYARQRKIGRYRADRVARVLGVDRGVGVRAATVEYAVLGVVALGPAVAAALAISARIGPVFERGPFPPNLELDVPVATVAMVALLSLAITVVIGVVVESRVGEEPRGG